MTAVASYLLAEAVSRLFHTVSPIPNFPATRMGSLAHGSQWTNTSVSGRKAPVKASGPFSSVSYVPNFHGDTGSTFTARSAVSDSRSFSSRRKESYSAI